ncbi:MAG TPA: AarF/UbiB family protein [Ktedonobacteraceae bacterium]|nr:AarF/UbiB family protein [Ktedonobacteraceae bacterium]
MIKSTKPANTLVSFVKEYLGSQFTHHPARCAEIARIIAKYHLFHAIVQLGIWYRHGYKDLSQETLQAHTLHAENVTKALEELGTCFIKLGQMLSTRPDLLPPLYINALSRLQYTVAPVASAQIIEIIERDLHAPLADLFYSFNHQPLAVASIAQVHKAILHNGKHVVLKVQRPEAQQQVEIDLEVLQEIAVFVSKYTTTGKQFALLSIVEEIKCSLKQELDFLQEADNTRNVSHDIREFHHLITPTIYPAYTTRHVLTLSFIPGRHLTQLSAHDVGNHEHTVLAKELLSAYLKQIIVNGIFHCDPHPGNMLLADDGRLALLDFGMIGRLDANQRNHIILLLFAFSRRQGERVADIYLEMLNLPEQFNRGAFTREVCALVHQCHDTSHKGIAIGSALLGLVSISMNYRLSIPANFTLLGKTLLNLDGALRMLSPSLNLIQVVRQDMLQVIQQRAASHISLEQAVAWFLDTKHLAENMLRKSDLLLGKLASEQIETSKQFDRLDHSIHRASRRLTLGMVVSSLILSLALLLNVKCKRHL